MFTKRNLMWLMTILALASFTATALGDTGFGRVDIADTRGDPPEPDCDEEAEPGDPDYCHEVEGANGPGYVTEGCLFAESTSTQVALENFMGCLAGDLDLGSGISVTPEVFIDGPPVVGLDFDYTDFTGSLCFREEVPNIPLISLELHSDPSLPPVKYMAKIRKVSQAAALGATGGEIIVNLNDPDYDNPFITIPTSGRPIFAINANLKSAIENYDGDEDGYPDGYSVSVAPDFFTVSLFVNGHLVPINHARFYSKDAGITITEVALEHFGTDNNSTDCSP